MERRYNKESGLKSLSDSLFFSYIFYRWSQNEYGDWNKEKRSKKLKKYINSV